MIVPELCNVENDICEGKCVADIGGGAVAVGGETVPGSGMDPGDRGRRVLTSAS